MSKRQFKAQASSGRFGGGFGGFGSAAFGKTPSSTLSYVQEPPDYSLISDANVGVAFKNLTKKDSTTKAKALEDLHSALITTDGDVEDAVVETWVKLYPRLSIDTARRVRQLAHTLHGQLCAKCGKRIAKYLPRIAGPWLAGTFDVDRAAAKAAQDAFATVFPSSDKAHGLRKTFQESILDHCKIALLDETVHTLSDERSVNNEDAEAIYARVVSSSIAVVTSLLEALSSNEVSKQLHNYEALLAHSKLWDFSSYPDASVRRSFHRFIQTGIKKQPGLVQATLKDASKAYIYKGLPSDQTGSAVDFALTLDALTSIFPTIWTDAYSGKKPAITRLQQCLKHGSHSSTTAFWDAIRDVIHKIPTEILPKSQDDAADLLLAARDGVTRKEERFNASSAWPTYFTLVDILTRSLSEEDNEKLIEAFVMPPVSQFIHPSEEGVRWNITGAKAARLVSHAALVRQLLPRLETIWPHLAQKLVEIAKTSQPEQSKDFDKSQKHVASTGERFSELQRELYHEEYRLPETLISIFTTSSTKVLKECVSLLKARNGKPWGAAAVVEEQIRACGPQLLQDSEYKQALAHFVTGSIPTLMYSASQRHLIRCIYATQEASDSNRALEDALRNVINEPEPDEAKARALQALFPSNMPQYAINFAKKSDMLQEYLVAQAGQPVDTVQGTVFADLLKLGAVSTETTNTVLSKLTGSLSLSGPELQSGLAGFELLAISNQATIQTFMSQKEGSQLLPILLKLEQSSNEAVADKAASISARLSSAMGDAAKHAKFGMILQNLESVSEKSLSIESVLDLASKIGSDYQEDEEATEMLPSLEIWRKSILGVINPLKPSLSLLSPLGGTLHLVDVNVSSNASYDADGLSQALRIAVYMARILKTPGQIGKLGIHASKSLALLNICLLLAEDNTSILGANGLWLPAKWEALEMDVMEFASEAHAVLRQYWETISPGSLKNNADNIFASLNDVQADQGKFSSMAYYVALARAKGHENLFEVHGYSTEQSKSSDEILKVQRAEMDALELGSFIVGYGQPLAGSPTLTRLCNELIADLTDLSMEADQLKGLRLLATLNIVLRTHGEILGSVQKTRLIFFLKRIISWLENDTWSTTKAEACKTVTCLVPHISDMYGEHWSQLMGLLGNFWTSSAGTSDGLVVSEHGILLVHASLKAYAALQHLAKADEPNDDLLEALKECEGLMHNGLMELLKSSSEASDETHQPLMVTNGLLARELSRTPLKSLQNAEELFPLLYAPSHAIQGAAFDLLHKQIPAAQEQISFDAALEDKTAQLPDELLSLIIDAPTLDTLADEPFWRTMPLSLQGFLYSWRVLFDHFSGSSYRVKSDYIEQLKDGGYISGLLNLVFEFLGHTRGRPIDASKFEVQEYVADMETSPERDVQWLLTHLCYLALSHLASLVKSYFLEIRSRQTSQAIEKWTAKYISPLIITANLQSVAEWAEKSVKEDPDYENMTVKVGMRSKEINVSYLVDEQMMAIKVVLPEAYPLDSAKVVSVNRVAVKEEKWQSWLRNCQGVITFSNGSITDGLSAWRKNVIGALKGQSECAICYSIISGDKQLPTKRCPTCKNLFHASCLFKWFKTSNASTCPLCRNPFNFN